MGTWGTRLYDDDIALDVKETYQMKIEEGKNKEENLFYFYAFMKLVWREYA